MRLIVAFLFAVICVSSWGETLITRDYAFVIKPKLVKHINIKKIQRPRLFRSNTLRLQSIVNHRFNDIDVDDTDIIIDRRRWNKEYFKPDEVSDHVRFRLWLARQLAMKKFAEVHSNLV